MLSSKFYARKLATFQSRPKLNFGFSHIIPKILSFGFGMLGIKYFTVPISFHMYITLHLTPLTSPLEKGRTPLLDNVELMYFEGGFAMAVPKLNIVLGQTVAYFICQFKLFVPPGFVAHVYEQVQELFRPV